MNTATVHLIVTLLCLTMRTVQWQRTVAQSHEVERNPLIIMKIITVMEVIILITVMDRN